MAPVARATLDFFAAQADARWRTAVLVLWFLLAWLGTIALVYVGLGAVLELAYPETAEVVAFTPMFLAATAAGVTLVTAAGSAFHAARLAGGGGHAVARMVGGVPVRRDASDAAEKRLLNVVEEMSIAAGLPVPAVYVLPAEPRINAFAAGFTPERGVVAVTRGAVEQLERDELQGVVAHELSHLLNADARLNLRLVSIVGGITVLALIGRTLAGGPRNLDDDDDGFRVRTGRRGGRYATFVLMAGLCLWAAGSIGAFFGRVIRAAVSRQREFLSDAAAVQFTRNPEGLAGALAKIAAQGSAIASAAAPEVSHFFFANALSSGWLATHPPVEERIRRILPQGLARAARTAAAAPPAAAPPLGAAPAPAEAQPASPAISGLAEAQAISSSAGRLDARHVAYAADVLGRLPPDVAVAARSSSGASALALALLADGDEGSRDAQLAAVQDPESRAEVARLAAALSGTSREDRMAILDLALPALDALSRAEAEALVRDAAALSAADARISPFEWAVQRIVRRRLARNLGEQHPPLARARRLDEVEIYAHALLSVLAWLGARGAEDAQAAIDAGARALGVAETWRPLPRQRVRLSTLDAALEWLDGAVPDLKRRILDACAATVLADGRVVAAEVEVLRAVAASLGVPLPPLRRGQHERAWGTV